jgi:hypothetical protein
MALGPGEGGSFSLLPDLPQRVRAGSEDTTSVSVESRVQVFSPVRRLWRMFPAGGLGPFLERRFEAGADGCRPSAAPGAHHAPHQLVRGVLELRLDILEIGHLSEQAVNDIPGR